MGKFLVFIFYFFGQDFLEQFAPSTALPLSNNGATVSGKMNGQLEVTSLALFGKLEEKTFDVYCQILDVYFILLLQIYFHLRTYRKAKSCFFLRTF